MMRGRVIWGMSALLAALAGCSVLPERPPPPALHDFGPTARGTAASPDAGAAVAVSAPEWLLDDQILYRLAFDDPTRVRHYNMDHWLAPPPSLLAQRLAPAINEAHRLHILLLDFEQIFDTPSAARVVMRFRATVSPSGDGTAERRRDFQLTRSCPTPDAKGAVTAFARVVVDADRQLQDWLTGIASTP